jgi:hypothetical protein
MFPYEDRDNPEDAMPQTPYSNSSHQPWYRSTLFLVLTFFLLPPVWAILIITDRSQRGPVTIFAYAVLVLIFLCGIGAVSSSVFLADTFSEIFNQLNIPLVSTTIPPTGVSPAITVLPSETVPATSIPPTVLANTEAVCTIVWVKHPQDLGRKTRARVYEELVSDRVKNAGMSPREFYDQVVEHNPELEADDYEFMAGKTYLLPECQ